jgi:hypothetical protein
MPRIDPFDEARRWGAHALFQLASWILRGSIKLYERHRTPPIVLRTTLVTARILEQSARLLLFGFRSVRGRRYPSRGHQR